ncbi:dynein light chain Tctex-type 5-like [Protopterus annectens]|uniref:dynein light chain Tctex-type 5-like n=1 Tax=Protopterus annectens TaxID=7888 RepID=UPI001CF970B4|nr:dynein light chain Tctex-type 5-like [Protopterus annectens]
MNQMEQGNTTTVKGKLMTNSASADNKLDFKASIKKENEKRPSNPKQVPVSSVAAGTAPLVHQQRRYSKAQETRSNVVSLRGLIAAQRFSKEFKERAALRAKKGNEKPQRQILTIINDQVPSASANPKERFSCVKAEKLIEEYLAVKLANAVYHPVTCTNLTKEICEEIKVTLKKIAPPRYKLICNVTVGNKDREDVFVASRCLWDPYADDFMSHYYENQTLFCVVTVYAVYFE